MTENVLKHIIPSASGRRTKTGGKKEKNDHTTVQFFLFVTCLFWNSSQ